MVVKTVIENYVEQFSRLRDLYLRERGADLKALVPAFIIPP